jgi:flagellar FliL protein
MADEELRATEAEGEGEGETPRKRRLLPLVGGLLMLMAGLAVGLWVVGPAAAERLAEPPQSEAEQAGEHESESATVATYTVDNLVLNPAETQGTRFLMASLVVAVDGEETAAALLARDAEIRDHLILLLGSRTVEELTDVGHRDALKEEIRAALAELAPSHEIVAVYLPTFVVQ